MEKGISLATLTHGDLDDVAYTVDNYQLDANQLRSVILNLITHIQRIEKRLGPIDLEAIHNG